MAEYRIYAWDGLGRIDFAEAILAESDLLALAKVREMSPTTLKCELWKGNRLVAKADITKALSLRATSATAPRRWHDGGLRPVSCCETHP